MIACEILGQAGLVCVVCQTIHELTTTFYNGAGAIILSDESFVGAEISELIEALNGQPNWSDVPVILMAKESQDTPRVTTAVDLLNNVMVIERPAPMRSLVSAVKTAVRARSRQYEIRDQLQQIAQAAEEFKVMADAIPQLAWMAHADGEVFWYNRRWTEFTGTTIDDVGGWRWIKVHRPDLLPTVVGNWKKALCDGVPFEMEFPLRGKDGNFRMFLTRAEPIRNDSGKVIRWFGTNTDIEEHKQLQLAREMMLDTERSARLEAERAARIKDEFVATLSHELRTPLSAILGWAYLIRLKANEPSTVTEGAEIIERNGRALSQLVGDLLDLSRIVTGKLRLDVREIDLGDVIAKAVDSTLPGADAKQIVVRVHTSYSDKAFIGDPVRLQQVVWNLVSNSIKFTPPKGHISVTLNYIEDEAVIQVTDDGEGIPPEFVPYLFDRFSQADASTARQHGGMGIGLSLVKQLVELHGGRVSVSSLGTGLGSSFTIYLPFGLSPFRSRRTAEPLPEWSSMPNLEGTQVMVVDDEQEVRIFVERLLKETGASISVSSSALEAIQRMEECPPDLLISDIGMPGQDGYDFIRKVRALGYTMPAIALTAFVRPQDRERAILAGFQQHLPKPVDPTHLLRMVEDLLS
jgi:PAS domain S-box-containing protein